MGTYVIGDIHGCLKEFKALVKKIEKNDSDAHFILVGDIVDRGPEELEMIRYAMKHFNKPDGKYEMLLGNHEYNKMNILRIMLADDDEETFKQSSDILSSDKDNVVSNEELKEIYEFFESLPIYKELDVVTNGKKQHYIITHGCLKSKFLNKDETFKKTCLKKKGMHYEAMSDGKDTVFKIVNNRNEYSPYKTILVHGHTPTVDGYSKGRIEFGKKYINVDCGCVYRKQGFKKANLAAIRLEDLEEFYLYKPVKMPEENQKYKDDILKVRRKYKPRIDEDFLYTLFENIGEN